MAEEGFIKYTNKNVPKVNAIRRAQSLPDLRLPPILDNGSVLFSSADSANNEPRSCANCVFYNNGRSCQLIGPHVPIRKFTWPPERTADSKPIEYWPVCGYWIHGKPNTGEPRFIAVLDPEDMGLGWVNAPKAGQSLGGTCCGGRNGGDDCDLWMTEKDDKRSCDTGFCRVLQKDTANMDCCSAWRDDDWITWQMAQERFNEGKI